ncbi:anthranilate phosphoribosyltransferase [Microthyrium microscopicum]|uniref:Anthranilate phosphoribosyltransferase n=1 Tax=Microthyrium microscopicum TaxID=703497 RepID=A0A6A6U8T4_9PEZI|nr:anthranilate phosphoribosyltransferase [Microthyrium microscopicum]
MASEPEKTVQITPLLKRLWPAPAQENVAALEIAAAISHIFTNSLTPVQTGALLTALHFTGLDRDPKVLAACASAMRSAAAPIDHSAIRTAIANRVPKQGTYAGGLCDIVGTGGDSHNTFNISTTASILASSYLLIAKHGNRASTSRSGSADLLQSTLPTAPLLDAITPSSLSKLYSKTNYAFLFAPIFHPGMRFVAPIRKELGWRTIFNLLGPLANPLDCAGETLLEARVIGVARRDVGPAFAESLKLAGAKRALVVCGDEELDELSCAGPTHCWQVSGNAEIEYFMLHPSHFGFPSHPLSEVGGGKEPGENAETLMRILRGEMGEEEALMHFVLINTAALLVISGICEADTSGEGDEGTVIMERGPGNGRWKEGVRRARLAIKSGRALQEWTRFVEATHSV